MTQNVGGQAVLEGVMMRGPRNWAVAVRKPDGEIAQVARSIDPLMARHWTLRLPVVRGVVALGESLAIGFRALSISANYAAQEEEQGEGEEAAEIGRWALAFAFLVAIGFALMMFKVGPALLTSLLPIHGGGWFAGRDFLRWRTTGFDGGWNSHRLWHPNCLHCHLGRDEKYPA